MARGCVPVENAACMTGKMLISALAMTFEPVGHEKHHGLLRRATHPTRTLYQPIISQNNPVRNILRDLFVTSFTIGERPTWSLQRFSMVEAPFTSKHLSHEMRD